MIETKRQKINRLLKKASDEKLAVVWQSFPNNKMIRNMVITKILKNNMGFLVNATLDLVDKFKYFDDFKQEIIPRTTSALDEFDITRGTKFSSYWIMRLKATVNEMNRTHVATIKPLIHTETIAEKEERIKTGAKKRSPRLLYKPTISMHRRKYDNKEEIEFIRVPEEEKPDDFTPYINKILEPLDEKERKIVVMHYGLETGIPLTYMEVSESMGYSSQRVTQLLSRAKEKMRKRITTGAIRGDSMADEILHSIVH